MGQRVQTTIRSVSPVTLSETLPWQAPWQKQECGVECLHHIQGQTSVRCCGCGKWFPDPMAIVVYEPVRGTMENLREYRIGFEHIPAGPYWPSIVKANGT